MAISELYYSKSRHCCSLWIIWSSFTDFESQLFVSSFYCYLNYDKNIDFVVDLDDIWKWLGFSQKIRAKECLEKYFKLDIDYKTAFSDGKAVSEKEPCIKQNGGHNLAFQVHNLATEQPSEK